MTYKNNHYNDTSIVFGGDTYNRTSSLFLGIRTIWKASHCFRARGPMR